MTRFSHQHFKELRQQIPEASTQLAQYLVGTNRIRMFIGMHWAKSTRILPNRISGSGTKFVGVICCRRTVPWLMDTSSCCTHIAQQATQEEKSQRFITNQALLGQGGKSAKLCVVIVNMLRSTLHCNSSRPWTDHPSTSLACCVRRDTKSMLVRPRLRRSVSYALVWSLVLRRRPTF
jgi:hypothetical protein